MPQKMSEHEQQAVVRLAKVMSRALPTADRAHASGIASGLVRLRRNPVTRDDMHKVLGKYGVGAHALDALVEAGIIERGAGCYRITAEGITLPVGARPSGAHASAGAPRTDSAEEPVKKEVRSADADEAANPADVAAPAPGSAGDTAHSAKPAPADEDQTTGVDGAEKPEGRKGFWEKRKAARKQAPGTRAADAAGAIDQATDPAPATSTNIATAPAAAPARARRAERSLGRLSCVRRQTPELTEVRTRIIALDPRLWINGWLLSTPEAYLRYEPELQALDAALAGRPSIGDGSCSLRELSYAIFGDEKFLAPESDGRKLLRLMGVSDLLRLRPPFKFELLSYVPKRHKHLRLVVSENLDPWTNMRNAIFFGERKRLLGERVHGVVFGNGALAKEPAHLQRLLDTMGADDVEILYWGDIDRAGFEIMARVAAGVGEHVSVKPFAAAYRLMLKRARKRWPDPLDNEPTDQQNVEISGVELLEPYLDEKEARYLHAVLDAALLIPQEAVLARDL